MAEQEEAAPAKRAAVKDPYAGYPYGVRAAYLAKEGKDPGPSPAEVAAEKARKARVRKK